MAEIKITDLVPKETIEEIQTLDTEIRGLLDTYSTTAKELAKGLQIDVKVVGDLDKLDRLCVEKTREAAEANEKLRGALERKNKILHETTNVVSRQLMEQERANKTQREAYTEHDRVKKLLEHFHDTYENQVNTLRVYDEELQRNKEAQKANQKALRDGGISIDDYQSKQNALIARHRELTQAKRRLNQIMTAEEKLVQSDTTSYSAMSQQLELLKKAYKELSEEGRGGEFGKDLEESIQNLDAHLKDVAADMGEFHRNVGNYAIAGQNGVVATESLVAVLEKQAVTMQDVADQTKILEDAKRMLDTSDEHYAETLAAINEQIEENKARLSDVSDIMEKDATTAAEAEAQNKRLLEAMRQIDLTAEDAQEKIDELNAKIERNNEVIDMATPSTERLAREQQELAESAKKAEKAEKKLQDEIEKQEKSNQGLADQVLSLIGINVDFASSLTVIKSEGDVWSGLGTKVKAFGKTLKGLLSNPWILTFLGIAGGVAAVKWWYEYNKGLERASLMTKNFTKLTGDDMRSIRTQTQTLADTMGKSFDDTIGAANTLANQFGISWDETMELMKDGVTLGADLHGNMIENIEKYAGAFRDAGIEADQFMAILVNTKDGLFDEKALKGITDAGVRIKVMSDKTRKALDDIGISSQKMQDDLRAGNITMVEAIQQVTDRLQELPPNAQEAGSVMVNVFGKKSALAGQEVIESISGINYNLEKMKEGMTDVQKINREQIDTQNELNATIASMFDMTGGGFEKMTKSAKLYMTKGLLAVVRGCVDIANWFIRMYNGSLLVRGGVNSIVNSFKILWEIGRFVLNHVIDSFKAAGKILEGVFTLNWGLVSEGWKQGMNALKGNVETLAKNVAHNFATAYNNTVKDEIKPINPKLDTTGASGNPVGDGGDRKPKDDPDADGDSKGSKSSKGDKEAEKRAKEELKRLQELEDAKIGMMSEGHEKELALIRQKFRKKLDEITGDGETEKALRLQLAEQCEKEVGECERKYQMELSKINLENRLAGVRKGSREERDLKLAKLESERQAEIKSAEQTGADVSLIEAKYAMLRQEINESYASACVDAIEKRYADEQSVRDNAMMSELLDQKRLYSKGIREAKGNAAKREKIERDYADRCAEIEEKYAEETVRNTIGMLEEILMNEDMSAEDRKQAERDLAKAKMDLETMMADHAIAQEERATQKSKEKLEERKAAISQWLQYAADAINNIAELRQALLDRDIQNIETEQEAHQKAAEDEQARISSLVDHNVITQEEGEARKRAAEAATARKTEELEKKKAALKHKQAMWDKANSLIQAGIATALAITQALPNFVIAAIVGAMGALEIATIAATPIPQYAKGTDYHRGGPAIVGDGGRPEVVLFNGGAWLTPDTPTLVDIPAGASVIPDLNIIDKDFLNLPSPPMDAMTQPKVVVSNDFRRLEEKMDTFISLIRKHTAIQHEDAQRRAYEEFKKRFDR